MNVLVVKANNRPASEAISSKMYESFMQEIEGAENLSVTTYDVFAEDTPYFGQELFDAFGKVQTGAELNDTEQRLLAAKQKAMDLLTAADVVVFAFPLWNLTIPAKLQTFIDYVYAAGFAFKYDAEGNMIQLMTDKKAIFLNARGGVYSAPEAAPMEMAVNYMRNVFGGIFGMEIIDEVIIEGHNASPSEAASIVEAGLAQVKEAAARLKTLA
ncbi:FMN-dependent NADH-azoreductase [Terribacillus saccharophilus]|uniref:FMN dependent NADH:quinone oxidoreductase n=1 Tax=Terribacillus saccharophilus TaxID=361277 RepID=A0A268AB95_9BACI|nr:FMN-dependent NADH-azoreductase [Terribacillus saccharophilus]PAD21403.1 FMN-dependent NADH-azoreductase [Terribacillus saccharophilus]PAF16849.1 FMN-dependent NADH-azoreductase [Terribacillus saccharophilus]PAF20928.1 FMN-dependent NADH-azoreductase [Terribacillus saccharophilus]PAF36305.1 FMN-dependent NADH-azoreductase [Terribacillus saccharophilus]PAF39585.1 FMN-dependent NADH-azoreductase [Terribacillus saccharophilus]